MNWPNDADGEVLRRLEKDDFDFTQVHKIDFNVDFKTWPPLEKAISLLSEKYGNVEVVQPDEDYEGYISFRIEDKLTYELVVQVQEEASLYMGVYQGRCESWGVWNG